MAGSPGADWTDPGTHIDADFYAIASGEDYQMNTTTHCRVRFRLLSALAPCLLAVTLTLWGQGLLAAEMPAVGTIQSLQQDGGIIRISGRNFNYSDEFVKIRFGDVDVEPQTLTEGMIVRYTLNSQGYLENIDIVGPSRLTALINEN